MSAITFFVHNNVLQLESGESLSGFKLSYQTFGKLNATKSNVVWIVHALTANSDPTEWWPGVVGTNEAINPEDHFIVCANTLGSHYGSTGPLDINPETGEKYYHNYPTLTNRDIVKSFIKLKEHLGITNINTLIGASLGGQQALEWAIQESSNISNLILLATNAQHSPYGIAFNESQRLAIEADQTWKEDRDDAGQSGLKAARSIALLSYRTNAGYDLKQRDTTNKIDDFKASSYQRYQGNKLVKRFNAFSYWVLSKAMDSHNVGRGRGTIESALSSITSKTTVVGITTDFLFPVSEQKKIAEHIPNATYLEIHSVLGHDGFLTESQSVSKIIKNTLKSFSKNTYLKVS